MSTVGQYYKGLCEYIIVYNKMLSRSMGNENHQRKLPSPSLQFSGLSDFSLSFNTIPIPSQVTFPKLGLVSCLSYHIGSRNPPNLLSDCAKDCFAPGFPSAARRPDARRYPGRFHVGWLENRYSFLWCFIVYRSVSSSLSFVGKLLYFCTLGWCLNNEFDAGCFQPLSLFVF